MNLAGSTRSTNVPDILGSVIATFDGTGALAKSAYLPYGTSTAAATPFGFTGQRIDAETGGNYYYRARHYSSVLGRFLQADPVGYSAGVHLYAYVGNDPLNSADPSGLAAEIPSSASGWSSGGGFSPSSSDFGTAGAGPTSWSVPAPSTPSVPAGEPTPLTPSGSGMPSSAAPPAAPVTPTVSVPNTYNVVQPSAAPIGPTVVGGGVGLSPPAVAPNFSGSPITIDNGISLFAADNQRANKQVRDIVVELQLDRDQQRQLHDAITGQGLGYHAIRELAIEMFGKPSER
jgi:RHS repeat-associated protein